MLQLASNELTPARRLVNPPHGVPSCQLPCPDLPPPLALQALPQPCFCRCRTDIFPASMTHPHMILHKFCQCPLLLVCLNSSLVLRAVSSFIAVYVWSKMWKCTASLIASDGLSLQMFLTLPLARDSLRLQATIAAISSFKFSCVGDCTLSCCACWISITAVSKPAFKVGKAVTLKTFAPSAPRRKDPM